MFKNIRIILIKTTEAGNIGATARAMKNMALEELYLVQPQNFPSSVATARASGADDILANATVVDNINDALVGVNLIIGSSARQRQRKILQLDVVQSCEKIKQTINQNNKVAIMFGTESSGLTNSELDLAHILMTIPGNSKYFSLNLAQAVQVFAYQNFITNYNSAFDNENNLADFSTVEDFYQHLFQTIEKIDYTDTKRPQQLIERRLRRIFNKAMLQNDEVAILRGILTKINKYEK